MFLLTFSWKKNVSLFDFWLLRNNGGKSGSPSVEFFCVYPHHLWFANFRYDIWLLSANTFRRDISSYRRDQLWVLSGRSEIFQICHSFLGSDKLKMLVLHACGRWPCLGLWCPIQCFYQVKNNSYLYFRPNKYSNNQFIVSIILFLTWAPDSKVNKHQIAWDFASSRVPCAFSSLPPVKIAI